MKKNGINLLTIILSVALCVVAAIVVITALVKNKPENNAATKDGTSAVDETKKEIKKEKETEKVEVSTAKIVSVGDILLHNPVLKGAYNSSTDSYDFSNIFKYAKKYFENADYTVANFEGSLGGTKSGKYSGYPLFNCPDEIVDATKNAGIDMLLTANNHAYDTNFFGMQRTLDIIDEKGVDRIGTRKNTAEKKYIVKEINGIKIGMICYTYETVTIQEGRTALNGILLSEEATGLVNSFKYDKLSAFYSEAESMISEMKSNGAEAVIFYIHWGNEYQTYTNSYQKEMAQKLCNLGVDLIVGGHPHVVQPIELLTSESTGKKTVCIYSVGNIISNQRISFMNLKTGHTEDGIIFEATFKRGEDGAVALSDINAVPIWVNLYTENGKQVFTIIPLDKQANWNTDFNLNKTSGGVGLAEKSYERTMAIVGDGLNKVKEALK